MRRAALLLPALMLPSALAQAGPPVPDRVESIARPARALSELPPAVPRRVHAAPRPHSISMGYVSLERAAAEAGAAPRPRAPRRIGFGRDIAELGSTAGTAARLHWQSTPQGGRIAALSITSPLAVGVRLGVLVRRLPADAVLRIYRQGAGEVHEISGGEVLEVLRRNLDAGERSDEARTYWAPHVEGEEATLEIELPPGVGPESVEIAVPRVSHFFASPVPAAERQVEKIGQAGSCEIDVSCYGDWSLESRATARMSFVESGGSYVCSGTLLNNRASNFTPYFLSANHCISSQTVASTLETWWFYRSTACNSGALSSGNRRLTGGANLLHASSATDTSFMQLRGAPPSGVSYAGWLTSAVSIGTPVAGLHHPQGDLQKISFGTVQSYRDCTASSSDFFSCTGATQATGEFLNAVFTAGTAETGSSGSGLFATVGDGRYLIGQLRGGTSSCSNLGGTNMYGRFDLAYSNALHRWLSGPAKGDFNGDGRSDLVWYSARTGSTAAWLMNGTGMLSFANLLTNPDWKVVAVRDLNGDGKADLVWHNARTGSTSAWLMNGTAMTSFSDLLTHPEWRVIAAGDLDGDGKADLVWHNPSTGETSVWLMDGTRMRSFGNLLTNRDWRVIATGDLDGDGKADLVWHNPSTGATSAWLMNGTRMLSFSDLLTNQDWKVIATGDLDGDGKSDLIWHHAGTGSTVTWLMDGTRMVSYGNLLTNPDWTVIATGDFNGDGKADLVWYNARTGSTSIWQMDGARMVSFGDLLTNPDWKVTGY